MKVSRNHHCWSRQASRTMSRDQLQMPRGRGVSAVRTHRPGATSTGASGVSKQMSSAPQASGAAGKRPRASVTVSPVPLLPSGPHPSPTPPPRASTQVSSAGPHLALGPPHGQSFIPLASLEWSWYVSHGQSPSSPQKALELPAALPKPL